MRNSVKLTLCSANIPVQYKFILVDTVQCTLYTEQYPILTKMYFNIIHDFDH